MEPNDFCPSLIDCLDTGGHGFYLDLSQPFDRKDGTAPAAAVSGPFSKRISTHVATGAGESVAPVQFIMQRSCYTPAPSAAAINNRRLENAWQNAWSYYNSGSSPIKPIRLKDQVTPTGALRAFAPLFHCRETRRWFHPVCPQCGMALTLCRDDELLKKRGLPGYSDSLSRFLYCASCSKLSDGAFFFRPRKEAGMPAMVHDTKELILQWKQLLEKLPEDADLPCRDCPEIEACYGVEGLAAGRIVAFAFFPFFFLILPAPSCVAIDFIRAISGDTAAATPQQESVFPAPLTDRFFFQGEDRQFQEILYLKLTFLQQVFDQLGLVEHPEKIQEFDFSLDSIGIDLIPTGTGLPAYWSFRTRMMDSVGSFQTSPFAPTVPEGARLHFLGAVWFHTLLVNSQQGAEAVLAAVGKLLQTAESGGDVVLPAEPDGLFAGIQVHWVPEGKTFPRQWEKDWRQALQFGFQLVRAGAKAGATWDGRQFSDALTELREKLKSEMFSEKSTALPSQAQTSPSARLGEVLGTILEKWQVQAQAASDAPSPKPPDQVKKASPAAPAKVPTKSAAAQSIPDEQPLQPEAPVSSGPPQESAGWEGDIEETVILAAPDSALSPESPAMPADNPQWDDDIQETVVLSGGAAPPPPNPLDSEVEADQTVVISPPSKAPPAQPIQPESDLEATMVQADAGPAPVDPGWQDGDMDATVVMNSRAQAPANRAEPDSDDDLAATLIQGAQKGQTPSVPVENTSGGAPAPDFSAEPDMEATVVIRPGSRTAPSAALTDADDEDLAATLIETPRSAGNRSGQGAPAPPAPPQPSPDSLAPNLPASEPPGSPDPDSEDDDIMEQTVIIRSEVKKE